jgi:hypothetical protein
MSFSKIASKYHDQLAQAMGPFRGRVVRPREMRAALVADFPQLEGAQGWVLPSDHCRNRTNKGACRCATTDDALFERIGWGQYRVL